MLRIMVCFGDSVVSMKVAPIEVDDMCADTENKIDPTVSLQITDLFGEGLSTRHLLMNGRCF